MTCVLHTLEWAHHALFTSLSSSTLSSRDGTYVVKLAEQPAEPSHLSHKSSSTRSLYFSSNFILSSVLKYLGPRTNHAGNLPLLSLRQCGDPVPPSPAASGFYHPTPPWNLSGNSWLICYEVYDQKICSVSALSRDIPWLLGAAYQRVILLLNPSQELRLNFNCAAGLHFEKFLNLLNIISSSAKQREWILPPGRWEKKVESGRKTFQSRINREPTPTLRYSRAPATSAHSGSCSALTTQRLRLRPTTLSFDQGTSSFFIKASSRNCRTFLQQLNQVKKRGLLLFCFLMVSH